MTITRDPEVPAEMAQLMSAFNRCADGHDSHIVLNAAVQMVVASIGYIAKSGKCSLDQAENYTQHIGRLLLMGVKENWNREAKPSDVEVRQQ